RETPVELAEERGGAEDGAQLRPEDAGRELAPRRVDLELRVEIGVADLEILQAEHVLEVVPEARRPDADRLDCEIARVEQDVHRAGDELDAGLEPAARKAESASREGFRPRESGRRLAAEFLQFVRRHATDRFPAHAYVEQRPMYCQHSGWCGVRQSSHRTVPVVIGVPHTGHAPPVATRTSPSTTSPD